MIKLNSESEKAGRQTWELPELRSPMQSALDHLVPIYYDILPLIASAHANSWTMAILSGYAIHS